MIKLDRPAEPQILRDNKFEWTENLQAAVDKYGSYTKIPDDEKKVLVAPYRHDEIREALGKSSHEKCAFCECHPTEGGHIQVEHFKPKSIYHRSTFEWDNLLPACGQCNGSKLDHDTEIEPLIDPYRIDPAQAFFYEYISIKPRSGMYFDAAKSTIEVCNLQGIRLLRPRADILISITGYAEALEDALQNYRDADTDRKRAHRLRKIKESLATIESLAEPKSKYSAFCSHVIGNCSQYLEAKKLLASGT